MSENIEDSKENKKEDSLDLTKYIKQLIPYRKQIIKLGCVVFVLSVVIALSMPKQYTVTLTLAPEAGQNGEGMLSGVASMLGVGGFNVGEDADALTAQLYPNIVASTPFLVDMLDTRVRTANGKMDTTLQAYIISQFTFLQKVKGLPYRAKKMITDMFKDPIVLGEGGKTTYLTEEKNGLVSILRECFEVAVDKKTSVSTIMVTFNDQMVTAMVADTLIEKLQEKITEYRLAKAIDDCRYWEEIYKESKEDYFNKQNEYARYVDTNKNIVLQSVKAEEERLENEALLAYQIYSNVATQLQMARAKIQEAKPAFVVVQPSIFPYEASGTSKTTTVLVLTFLGVALIIAWYLFGKEYWIIAKNKFKEFKTNTKEINSTNS
ncbi:MAG: chain-length determining protein [Bacteroidales bacterium]|nr:chain-length determining protein [Bacteroidales bacterium]MBQ7819845.1 chain-length determining protein [Bacteroidales bacterium]